MALLLGVPYSTVVGMQHRTVGAIALSTLIGKFLESDQDADYTNGSLRDFRLVRQDFNLLGELCFLSRHRDDPDKMDRISRVICPAKVVGSFSEHAIFPKGAKRGRKRKHVNPQ